MIYQNNELAPRWRAISLLLISCALFGAAMPPRQQDDDDERRLMNKQFEKSREVAEKLRRNAQAQTRKTKQPARAESDDQLIGVTIWRLRQASEGDKRLLMEEKGAASNQHGRYEYARATSDAFFKEGEHLRISVEASRLYDNYLYVIDREVHKDKGKEILRGADLIFPSPSTPIGETMVMAGKSVYVPARNDQIPYFTLQRSGQDHIGESVTVIISPKPLPVNVGQPEIDPAMLAQWERQCGAPIKRGESNAGVGKTRTKEEQDADENNRKLVQGDPMPQTIYRVRASRDGCAMVTIPLRIAPGGKR
jgi:hypothetical protein